MAARLVAVGLALTPVLPLPLLFAAGRLLAISLCSLWVAFCAREVGTAVGKSAEV
jgi:hypothetical protein